MLKTLHGKLSLVLMGLLCLVALFYGWLTLTTTQRYLQEVNQKLNRTVAIDLTKDLAAKNLLRRDDKGYKGANAEISHLMAINPNVEVYLLDSNGVILAYSAAPGKVRRSQVSVGPLRELLSETAVLPILGDDPRGINRQKIFSVSEIPPSTSAGSGQRENQLQGYVYVILGSEEYDSAADLLERSYILRSSLWLTLGILLFVSSAGLILFTLLTRPLRRLTRAMETFQQNDFQQPMDLEARSRQPQRDEIGRLEAVCNGLARRVLEQVRELKRADEQRRELVSNVSHDLRTPLAALQGYLETLHIKEGQLSPQEQQAYLSTATKHGERLSRLVAELFELAQLDSSDMQLHTEPFSLAELVQDIVQQFQVQAQQIPVTLQARFPEDLPFVAADIGLIERAIGNLLENAIRYTSAGGAVTITLVLSGASVAVQLTDSGTGIEPEDLPHIFERSYRGKHQPEHSEGAGLGLAITRRILELHGSAIEATSSPGAGTTFVFELPVSSSRND